MYQLLDPYIMAFNTTEHDFMRVDLSDKFNYRINLTLTQFYETREKTHAYWRLLSNAQRNKYHRVYVEPLLRGANNTSGGGNASVSGEKIFQLMDAVIGDWGFVCGVNEFAAYYYRSTRTLQTSLSSSTSSSRSSINTALVTQPQPPNIYMYYFLRRSSANPWPLFMGTLHAEEIDFFFGRVYKQPSSASDADRALSNSMIQAFAAFAITGDPSYAYPSWKPWQFYSFGYQLLDIVNTTTVNSNTLPSRSSNSSSSTPTTTPPPTRRRNDDDNHNYRYPSSSRATISQAELQGKDFYVQQKYVSGTLPRQDMCPVWRNYPLPTT